MPLLSLWNKKSKISLSLLMALLLQIALQTAAQADPTRVLPEGKQPSDRRLMPLKDLNGYFPFEVPETREEWQQRAELVRRRILISQGLWPMPTKTPVNAVVHGKIERDDYTVEKVFLESIPGFYVTGSLYRPQGKQGKLPAVLCPHGHWPNGRFHDHGEQKSLMEIAAGAERFEGSGRYPLQARCVQLARMGCIVFHYDMIGYADSEQLSFNLVHRFGKQRPEMDSPDRFGFYSTQAELRLLSVMGLQTLNSIRALDWLMSREDVDPDRIAITGASGGGTQTFLLSAIDPRVDVSFPAVMVSTAMQGGCTCENSSLLRIGTGNIEFAALFAPKPLAMTAAKDWTVEIATKGLPELKELYKLMGAPLNVEAYPFIHFPHNYNAVSRMAMYNWMNKHLKLGLPEPVIERDFEPLTQEELTVWNAAHPKPLGGDDVELAITKYLAEDSDQQIAALTPKDADSLAKYQEVVGGAYEVILDRGLSSLDDIEREKIDKQDKGDYWLFKDLIRYKPGGEEIPVIFLHPKKWNGQVVLWFEGEGKSGLFDSSGAPDSAIKKLLDEGVSVASADLFMTGEFLAQGEELKETRVVNNPREAAAYTHGYNNSVFAKRVQDIRTLASYVIEDKEHEELKGVSLVGVAGAGPWVAAARTAMGDKVQSTAVDTEGFRFSSLQSYRDPNFLIGAVKYGDLPGMLALSTPGELLILGEEGKVPAVVKAAYEAAGKESSVTSLPAKKSSQEQDVVNWLLK